jgi:DNA-binding GntR family transcriptional regulator
MRIARLLALADQLNVETQRYRLPSLIGGLAGKRPRDVPRDHEEIMEAALRRNAHALDLLAAHYRRTSEFIAASTGWSNEK